MLKARVITALFLVAGLLGVLFYAPPLAAVVTFGGIAALAAWEWAGLMKIDRMGRIFYAVVVVITGLAIWDNLVAMSRFLWQLSAIFWLVLAPLWLWRRWSLASNDFVGYGVGWLLLAPTWTAMVALHAKSPWLLLAAMALVWVADIAAYFTGRAFGRVKLAPAISPGKTREGAYGAIAAVLVFGVVVALASGRTPAGTQWLAAACALVLFTVLSIVGDLFESLMKRQAEVKDSSQLLPGHGGVLDRIDSLVAVLPLMALVLTWTDT